MLTCKIKYNDNYDFELPITREGRAFYMRSINSNTIKAHDLIPGHGLFLFLSCVALDAGFFGTVKLGSQNKQAKCHSLFMWPQFSRQKLVSFRLDWKRFKQD